MSMSLRMFAVFDMRMNLLSLVDCCWPLIKLLTHTQHCHSILLNKWFINFFYDFQFEMKFISIVISSLAIGKWPVANASWCFDRKFYDACSIGNNDHRTMTYVEIFWNSLSFYSTHLHATNNGETVELFHFPTNTTTTTTTQHSTAIANATRIKAYYRTNTC